jgi:glucose/arabinose dehydrogenase
MRRLLVGLAVVGALSIGACALWPERLAVNAPLANALFGWGANPPPPDAFRERVRVPEGFSISVYAAGLKRPRFLRFTGTGDLLLSQPSLGRIALLERDADGDGRPDGRRVVLEGLNRPHGMDFLDGWLYVAETDAVGRIRFDATARATSGSFERVVTGLPDGGNHWTRTLRFGPDGWMYVSIGSSCNVCLEADVRRATLMRFRPDGSEAEIYARGLRNTVGFDWRPGTGELYGTDNGRDLLGDDFPPCELNRIERGKFYGWPHANDSKLPDPDYGEGYAARIRESVAPAHGFGAHTAPLGITFLHGRHWPPAYRGAALVAQHGSWNRTQKSGYQIVSLHWDERGTITERPFAWGFEVDEDVIGRPVDVAEGHDGAIYVSDDYAGAIYRVVQDAGASAAAPADAPQAALELSDEQQRDSAAEVLATHP